jgi:hypothetical protein
MEIPEHRHGPSGLSDGGFGAMKESTASRKAADLDNSSCCIRRCSHPQGRWGKTSSKTWQNLLGEEL